MTPLASDLTPTQVAICGVLDDIERILVEKNRAYGDSALDPVRIFSQADSREQLLVRIDDKLSRVARGHDLSEDVVLDLIGYLVLLRVSDRRFAATETTPEDRDAAFEQEKDDMIGRFGTIAVERVR